MKNIAFITPTQTTVLKVNDFIYWLMKRFGFKWYSEKTLKKIKGLTFNTIVFDDLIPQKD